MLLVTTCVLFAVLLKPDIWLNKHVQPTAQGREIRSLGNSVEDLESCVGDDSSFGGSWGLGSACNDSLSSRIDDLDGRVDDACDQIYRKFSDSQGC